MNFYVILFIAGLAALLVILIISRINHENENIWQEDRYKIDLIVEQVQNNIDEMLDADYTEMSLRARERKGREKKQAQLRKATRNACLGDRGDREILKSEINNILIRYLNVNSKTISRIIPFDNPDEMSAQDKFEHLYTIIGHKTAGVFRFLDEQYQLSKIVHHDSEYKGYLISDEDIHRIYDDFMLRHGEEDQYITRLETVVQRIYQLLYGHDVADNLINDPSLDCVSAGVGGIHRSDYVYLEEIHTLGSTDVDITYNWQMVWVVFGKLIRLSFLAYKDEESLMRVVNNIYRFDTRSNLSSSEPIVQGTFKDNSRVMCLRPPVNNGYSFFVRKFHSTMDYTLKELVGGIDAKDNSDIVTECLQTMAQTRMNFFISGNPGGGKTTLLKLIIGECNPQLSLRVVEHSYELDISARYPKRNILALQERGNKTIFDLIQACKRLDTDILIVGECNEPKIAGACIQVAQSGSSFFMSTIHTTSLNNLVNYLRNALVECTGLSSEIAEEQVVNVLNFDVHQVHDADGNHYIEYISELVPTEDTPYPDDPKLAIVEALKRIAGKRKWTERVIIRFNRDTWRYDVINELSAHTLALMKMNVGNDQPEHLNRLLRERIAVHDTLKREKCTEPSVAAMTEEL